jgi:hypothetical protein
LLDDAEGALGFVEKSSVPIWKQRRVAPFETTS